MEKSLELAKTFVLRLYSEGREEEPSLVLNVFKTQTVDHTQLFIVSYNSQEVLLGIVVGIFVSNIDSRTSIFPFARMHRQHP